MTVVLIVLAAVVIAIGALVGLQLPELRRYMKMRKM
jgi:predicted membrane-bound spermidine synthase